MNTTTTVKSTSPGAPTGLASLHVLLVDDDPFMHELVGTMLRQMGVARVAVAADGERAVAAIADGRIQPDVIICDIAMPGKDGFQVMESMAERGFKGGLVLLSGMEARVLNSAALMGRFHNLNILGVVSKPIDRAALKVLLSTAARA